MDMGRMLGKRHLVRDPVAITVRSGHTQWFYDKLCSRAERIINNGYSLLSVRTKTIVMRCILLFASISFITETWRKRVENLLLRDLARSTGVGSCLLGRLLFFKTISW